MLDICHNVDGVRNSTAGLESQGPRMSTLDNETPLFVRISNRWARGGVAYRMNAMLEKYDVSKRMTWPQNNAIVRGEIQPNKRLVEDNYI